MSTLSMFLGTILHEFYTPMTPLSPVQFEKSLRVVVQYRTTASCGASLVAYLPGGTVPADLPESVNPSVQLG